MESPTFFAISTPAPRTTIYLNSVRMLVLFFLLLPCTVGEGSAQKLGETQKGSTRTLCEILHAAERYNGEQISVPATYRVAYEASAIYCLSCSESGEVWVEFDTAKGGEKAGKAVDRLVRTREMVNGVFTGGFHSGGDMATCLRIDISYRWGAVRDLKVVDRLGLPPASLSQNSRAKVCK